MNFTYFLTPDEVKQNGLLNANVDVEYIEPSLQEAQSVFCREILGDLLYKSITNKINSDTLTGKYQTLLNDYIKPYMGYKMLSLIALPLNFKLRNMGVVSQYGDGVTSASVKDTAYIQEQYDSKAEFYANRLTVYLQKNASNFPEYGYSDDNITQPTESQNVTTIYLGTGRKKCGCSTPTKGGGGGGTGDTVDWSDVTNKPSFATVATSGDYGDLNNKPNLDSYTTKNYVDNAIQQVELEMPTVPTNVSAFTNDAGYLTQHQSLQGLATENYVDNAIQQVEGNIPTKTSELTNDSGYITQHQSLDGYATENWVQEQGYSTFDGDYNSLTNKPTIPTVPTNVSAFTNDAGYLTQHQSLDGYATEEWVSEQGFSTFSGSYEDLTDKPTIPTVNDALLTIKQGGVTKGTFSANSNQNIEIDLEAGGSGSTDWNDIQNKPSFATVATSGDYEDLTNKPTIPTVPTNVSAFTNDAGYLTQHQSLSGYATETWVQQQGYTTFDGDYNSLTNKPTIPAAQVQSDWNATSGMGEILNKPSLATVATTGSYSDLTNKPTIPTAPVQSDWNESNTTSLAYIANKPTIPAAQVQSDWNATSGMGQIRNKPSMTAETWTFTLSDNTTVTKTVWLQ